VADHPVKVPQDLAARLWIESEEKRLIYGSTRIFAFANLIAQWAADQELRVCCDAIYLHEGRPLCGGTAEWLRATRRPSHKPPDTVEIDGFTYRLVK
jgi:hypothetical protein